MTFRVLFAIHAPCGPRTAVFSEPAGVRRVERWLWPFGLHWLFIAEKPRA